MFYLISFIHEIFFLIKTTFHNVFCENISLKQFCILTLVIINIFSLMNYDTQTVNFKSNIFLFMMYRNV